MGLGASAGAGVSIGGAPQSLREIQSLSETLRPSPKMPVVFLGHGSPMNIIQDNPYRRSWQALGQRFGARDSKTALPTPQLILCVSAHWMTNGRGFWVTGQELPRTIHDFGGFPDELYAQRYPAPGAPEHAQTIHNDLRHQGLSTFIDTQHWGFDHGSWGVLLPMFPTAHIPTLQLSIDMRQSPEQHWQLGQALQPLREKGVLIVGSGNVVHNLGALMRKGERANDWGSAFDHYVHQAVSQHQPKRLAIWESAIVSAGQLAHPSLDHYLPLLTAMGAATQMDHLEVFNAEDAVGPISMRSFLWHAPY